MCPSRQPSWRLWPLPLGACQRLLAIESLINRCVCMRVDTIADGEHVRVVVLCISCPTQSSVSDVHPVYPSVPATRMPFGHSPCKRFPGDPTAPPASCIQFNVCIPPICSVHPFPTRLPATFRARYEV